MKQRKACIFGGTGFIGQHLLMRLGKAGYQCVVPTRRPHRHRELKLVPQTTLREIIQLDEATLADCMAGCDVVVNLIGILNEQGNTRFAEVHVELVQRLGAALSDTGVPRLLHMSALQAHAERGSSAYLRSKGLGEDLAHTIGAATPGLAVTSFRPSVVFGRGDSLFNRFASLLRLTPGILPLAAPDARFAPVWAGDVAEAMVRTLTLPESAGRRYDLCGPRIFTLREIVEYSARRIGRRVLILPLNERQSALQARLLEYLPGKPLTRDNLLSLKTASICGQHNGLLELGVHPTDIETVVPTYL
ncbi:MAG: complex I NDUFA9 subunit family protein [Chromatiaceae bacterium]|nr:MAG: complex I NDUFA9 subunit family protein [Chromatiaceae bacterium]